MRAWEVALQEHKDAVLAAGYQEENILGIFVYGSQNYGVATDTSDWDTKAIIVPSYADLVLRPAVSKEIHLANNEHCEVKDIREIVKMFKKQNINFLEILYTQYKWVNPMYEKAWEEYFVANRELITHYDINKTIQSICGQAIHTLDQNPTDGKKVANGLRLLRFLEKFLAGDNYEDCIVLSATERQRIVEYKNEKEVRAIVADAIKLALQNMKAVKFGEEDEQMQAIDEIMNQGIFAVLDIMIFY